MNDCEKIEELLLAKDYEQLSETEKSIVSKFMTAREYCKMRDHAHAANEFIKNEIKHQFVPKSIEDSIMNSFDHHHRLNADILNHKFPVKRSVPLWAFAASIGLLIVMGGLLMQWKSEAKTHYLTQTDTLYEEKHIVDTIFVEKDLVKSEHRTKAKTAGQGNPSTRTPNPSSKRVAASVGISVPDPETLRNTKNFPVGTSMSEDAAKERLTVEIL